MNTYQVVGVLSEIDTEPESEDSMHVDSESDDMYSSCSDSDNDSNMDDNGSNASSSDEADTSDTVATHGKGSRRGAVTGARRGRGSGRRCTMTRQSLEELYINGKLLTKVSFVLLQWFE